VPVILKNSQLELHLNLPDETYNATRFDYTGKIIKLVYQNILLSGSESLDLKKDTFLGKGFYNEFDIDQPFNFTNTAIGDWFHKIGVGLLQKTEDSYFFHKIYQKKSLSFKVNFTESKICLECISPVINGCAYILKKEIVLLDSGFCINYHLENTGDKEIVSTEYAHNFLAFNNDLIGSDYVLKFPFEIKPELFKETLNTEKKVTIEKHHIRFNGTPNTDFFFSNLSGNQWVRAQWELINTKHNIGIRETGDFKTNKINLWGVQHVICPELFYHINLKQGQSQEWSRTYDVFKAT
tara:strand:+ start:23732 stop:24616 length:885 start_codon:yes stop_codon:yes gene_type:complete